MLSNKTKMLRLSALSLAVAGAMSFSHAASAEGVDVSGSVGVANMYLWRGYDLGAGNSSTAGLAAVSGDLKASYEGAYAGVWGSSGDAAYGTEYDLYVGYGAEFSGVSVDLSVWTYEYPSASIADGLEHKRDFANLSEAILSVGYAGLTATVYDNITGGTGYEYYTLAYSYDAFTILVGKHDFVGADDMTHVDLSYAYNDNLTFTVSQQVDNSDDGDRAKFVASYSLPIGD